MLPRAQKTHCDSTGAATETLTDINVTLSGHDVDRAGIPTQRGSRKQKQGTEIQVSLLLGGCNTSAAAASTTRQTASRQGLHQPPESASTIHTSRW